MQVSFVRPVYAGHTWPLIKDFVADACDHSGGRFTPSAVLHRFIHDEWSLWVFHNDERLVKAFVGTSLRTYDAVKLLRIEMLGGEEMSLWENKDTVKVFEDFARGNGCSGIEAGGRKGWIRIASKYGWTKDSHSIEKRWDD